MKNRIKTRVRKTTVYLIDHAPQLVTTTAALGTLYVAHKHSATVRDYILDDRSFRDACKEAITNHEAEGNRYTFFPGVGVLQHLDPPTD